MSVSSLIQSRGVGVLVKRAAYSRGTDGTSIKTYSTVLTTRAFVQQRGSRETKLEGRLSTRNDAVIYFDGAVDVLIDDLIYTPTTGKSSVYSVTGCRIPDEMQQVAGLQNTHTIVDAQKALPLETI